MKLTFFSNPNLLHHVDRNLLTRLLGEDFKHCLPPEAAAILAARPDYDQWCAAWAAQFSSPAAFGAPLLEALVAIETLSLPENAPLLEEALTHLPPGYEVNRGLPSLNQALHLWIISSNTPGVVFPLRSAECGVRSDSDSTATASPPDHSKIRNPQSEMESPSPQPSPKGEGVAGGVQSSTADPQPSADSHQTIEEADRAAVQKQYSKTDDANQSAICTPHSALEDSAIRAPQSAIEEAAFQRLAVLPPTEYDRVRKAEAKRLGLRLATLDDEVDRCRDRLDEAEAENTFLAVIKPWPEPITDAPALFDAVHDRFTSYAYLPAGAAVVCSTFLGHTHAFSAFHYTPRINILSQKDTCGKSTVVKVIASMAPKPFGVQNLRPPVVYRIIDKRQPTVCLDEVETFLPLFRELLGLLNAGNSSDACVPRCEGKHVHIYKAFAPVVLAGIGDLFRTLRSRSILIHMTECPEGVKLTRFDSANVKLEEALAQKLARWAVDNLKAIAACDPPLPPGARNRVADNWRPLFQIAHVIGGHWPDRVTEAFHALRSVPQSAVESPSPQPSPNGEGVAFGSQCSTFNSQLPADSLLSDIRSIFAQSADGCVFSRDLLIHLNGIPGRTWSDPAKGKPLTERSLARRLQHFGIRPRTVWIGGTSAKGYLRKDFQQILNSKC